MWSFGNCAKDCNWTSLTNDICINMILSNKIRSIKFSKTDIQTDHPIPAGRPEQIDKKKLSTNGFFHSINPKRENKIK